VHTSARAPLSSTVKWHLATPKHQRSGRRTEGYLRDARSNLSQIAEAEFSGDIQTFEELLEHNELGLAFDTLEAIARQSAWESLRIFELLALAAASMDMAERQRSLDLEVTKLRGWEYKTVLPGNDT
jgi:hypothetical protein